MANNPYVNKVVYGGDTLIDLTDATATADKILQGYTAYGADGQKLTGTATGGGGSVTQDQDGFIVLPPDGGGSPSVGGLVYEEGTWTPSEDVDDYTISFTNTHATAPFYYMITDAGTDYYTTSNTNYLVCAFSPYLYCGSLLNYNGTSSYYMIVHYRYRATSAAAISGANSALNDETSIYTWSSSTGIRAYTTSTSRYWRAGRTYKWIAVWAPTT